MREKIQNELARVERDEEVSILYAVESGSRAWGFASPDSDWDVRFVYVHPRDWYLTIEPGRDVIEQPIDAGLDLVGWDLRKALVLFRKGNPPLLEWLSSPHIYLEQTSFAMRLRAEVESHFKPANCIHHYLSMARKNYREYLKRDRDVRLKKYFYVLRPLLAAAWTMRHEAPPPMEFAAALDDFGVDATVRTEIDDLLVRKRAGDELARGPQRPLLNRFIEERIEATEAYVASLGRRELPPRARLDALFRELLTEAWGAAGAGSVAG